MRDHDRIAGGAGDHPAGEEVDLDPALAVVEEAGCAQSGMMPVTPEKLAHPVELDGRVCPLLAYDPTGVGERTCIPRGPGPGPGGVRRSPRSGCQDDLRGDGKPDCRVERTSWALCRLTQRASSNRMRSMLDGSFTAAGLPLGAMSSQLMPGRSSTGPCESRRQVILSRRVALLQPPARDRTARHPGCCGQLALRLYVGRLRVRGAAQVSRWQRRGGGWFPPDANADIRTIRQCEPEARAA